MALKDIIGQERAIEILRGCIKRNRVAHAYIFAGDEGIGKKLTAINFAKALNCQNNRNASSVLRNELKNNTHHASRITHHEIDCCDGCSSCIKINKSIHPDFFFIAPENGEIKVDVIRELQESISYKAFEGGWKVIIIDEAETLNQSAANAFLKTLEEPPEQTILILISSMSGLIPKTILSRCQRVNFSPLPFDKIGKLLENKFSTGETMLISMLSGGRPGWALSNNLIEKRDKLFNEFKSLIDIIGEDLLEGKDSLEEWFEWVHLWLRDIAVLKATGDTALLINQDREKEIRDISNKAGLSDILKLSNTLYNIKNLLRFNLNKKITINHTHFLLKETFADSS
ncbi:MAG: DNA polymerase III subunit delta' [Nitrospirota bacterium]